MFKAASKDRISSALRRIANDVEAARISPREATLRLHRVKMALSQTAEQALEAMGPIQANSREEVMKGFKSANPDLTDAQLEEIADQWEANKDVVKDKTAAASSDWTLSRRMDALYADFKKDVEAELKKQEPEPGVAKSVKMTWLHKGAGFMWLKGEITGEDGEQKKFSFLPEEPSSAAGEILFKVGGY